MLNQKHLYNEYFILYKYKKSFKAIKYQNSNNGYMCMCLYESTLGLFVLGHIYKSIAC